MSMVPRTQTMTRFYGVLMRRGVEILFEGWNKAFTLAATVVAVAGGLNERWGQALSDQWDGVSPLFGVFVPLIVLFVYGLARANFEAVRFRDAQIAQRDERIERLESQPTPNVIFHDPRIDDDVPMAVPGRTQPFAFGRVENFKSHAGKGAVGEGARVELAFYVEGDDTELLHLVGRWRSAPSPTTLHPLQLHPDAEVIPLRPNGTIYEFDLATKRRERSEWYAIDSQQKPHKLPSGVAVIVHARVAGDNFDGVDLRMKLVNHGAGGGLSVERVT